MRDQLEIEELSNILEHEKTEELKKLEIQLAQAEESANNNKAASDILNELI